MQLMSLRLRNVRRFIEPIEITGLTAGVNVLAAPNEHGKSTVFDALHAAFFLSHKSMNAETRGLVPHAGGDPEVDVRFTVDGATWRLNKRWSKAQGRRQAKLWRNETLVNQAGEAEDVLAALLAPPADGGPAGLLWVRQGLTGLAEKGDEAKARHSLLTSVTGEIDAMTGGRQMDDLLARIHMELTQHLTATGKIRQGGPLHAAADEVAALEESHQRLSDARDALRGALARRAQLRAERRRLEDPEDAARRAQTLAAAKEAMTAGEAHAARLRTAMEAARTARLTAEATVAERARLTAALKEQRDANAAVAKAQSVEADARAGADASATAYESARALRSEAQRFEQAAR
ncbi:MAG: AAA family ATPase, partial [Pseudomonadota bacterium]